MSEHEVDRLGEVIFNASREFMQKVNEGCHQLGSDTVYTYTARAVIRALDEEQA